MVGLQEQIVKGFFFFNIINTFQTYSLAMK